MPLSRTSTSIPERASHHPALRPVTPPPMMTTDAPLIPVMSLDGGRGGFGAAWHRRRDRFHLPVGGPLRGDAEPDVPIVARRLGLVVGPKRGERQGTHRRAI